MKTNSLYRILISSYGISTFSEGIIMPIYAIFVQGIGGDILDASSAIAVFLIVSGIATVLIHRIEWSQKHRIRLMVYGWLIWMLGITGYFLISSTTTLLITQVLIALGNAIATPAFDAELDDHTDEAIKSYEWSLFEAMQSIFSGFAAIIGGIIATLFGFRLLILVMIFTATISFLMILYYVVAKNRKIESGGAVGQNGI